jgi:hypothetical protein
MKTIVVTVIACATAITCVVLLRLDRSSAQPRYQLYGIDEISPFDGKTVKSVFRLDTISGKTWRLSSNALATGVDKPSFDFADGWEEMPESPEAALAKGRAKWDRVLKH